jgi:hypothetical protein
MLNLKDNLKVKKEILETYSKDLDKLRELDDQ